MMKKQYHMRIVVVLVAMMALLVSGWAQADLGMFIGAWPSLTRTWEWTIDKTADQTDLVLSPGQQHLVNYQVTVDTSGYTEGDYAVTGGIRLYSVTDVTATITGVTAVISPGIPVPLDFGVTFPHDLPPQAYIQSPLNVDMPDGSTRTITVEVTTSGPIPGFTGQRTIDFSTATVVNNVDACITATDDMFGYLGEICVANAPQTFEYSMYVGPFSDPDDCGEVCIDNTAAFETNDTATTGEDSWTVCVLVACEGGCTLTPGYWKTHSIYGPAPYDDTWAAIGEDTPFFLSGQTYYEVLWTPPKRGNAYYILAHAYIAAELNELNEASVPDDVAAAFAEATAQFEAYTPGDVAAFKKNSEERALLIALAELLDDYNNGLIGPGHCDEDDGPEPDMAKMGSSNDTNGDGLIDAADVQMIINAVLGL